MPKFHLQVNVTHGKRTDTEVSVTYLSNNKTRTFKDGLEITNGDFAYIVAMIIEEYLSQGKISQLNKRLQKLKEKHQPKEIEA